MNPEIVTDDTISDEDAALTEVTAEDAAARLMRLLALVDYDSRTIYLTRDGQRIAAIVPADAAEYLERIEDEYYAHRIEEARSEGGDNIPWEQVKAELGLDDEEGDKA